MCLFQEMKRSLDLLRYNKFSESGTRYRPVVYTWKASFLPFLVHAQCLHFVTYILLLPQHEQHSMELLCDFSLQWNSGQADSWIGAHVQFITSRYHPMLYWPNKWSWHYKLPRLCVIILHFLGKFIFNVKLWKCKFGLPRKIRRARASGNLCEKTQNLHFNE
jgi:hypothetical protein